MVVNRVSKIAIIGGGGTVGSTAGFLLALNGVADEVCLIDINRNLALNHVMDMENAIAERSATRVYAGDMSDLAQSDVIIVTASVPNRNVTSRLAFLEDNLKVMDKIGESIAKYAPEAVVVMASNPVDLLNYYLWRKFGLKREKCLGYTLNDSIRFAWAIRHVVGLDHKTKLFAPVIGEHGSSQVPLFSQVKADGKPLSLTTEQKEKVRQKIHNWFLEFNQLQINRTSGWTSGVGLSEFCQVLLDDQPQLVMASAILEGEYGLDGLSIGVPVMMARGGLRQILEWPLSDEEQKQFEASAKALKEIASQTMTF